MNKWLILVISCLICACSKPTKMENATIEIETPKYASGFHFKVEGNTRYLVVDQPWPNAVKPIHYLIESPPERIVCTSTSHLPFFELLKETSRVVGFPNLKYISSSTFIERAENGLLTDLGPDGGMNMELLMSIHPDIVIAFDMGGESNSLDKIQEAGIPVYYNSDFLEKSPLGRAEWIKFFGAILGKEQMADSIFQSIETAYLSLRKSALKEVNKPLILSGVVYGDTWFTPGGNNWAANFFNDAGGEYLWNSDSTSGWLELGFESVYEKGNNAPFWIGTSTINSKKELISQDMRYQSFKAYQIDQVYNYSKKIGPNGGYDFFESGYARPDLVLADLVKIIHPTLLPDYQTVYFEKLP